MAVRDMNDDNTRFGSLQESAERVLHFTSPVPLEEVLSPGALRKWVDIPSAELNTEVIHRNGRFQSMLGFMRHTLQGCIVTDANGRLVYINHAAEHLWKQRLWDVQGKSLSDVMHLNTEETARNRCERDQVLKQRFPGVYLEHFHTGGQRISMFCFPFPDDNNDFLLGAFILHSGNGLDPKPGY